MDYTAYLRLEGLCSIVLGVAMAVLGAPGVVVDQGGTPLALLAVPALLAVLALAAARGRRADPLRPGQWLTARPLATATADRAPLAAPALRRRLVVETALWIVGVSAWLIVTGSSAALILGTGLASVAFGLVQAVAARRRVAAVERATGVRYLVAERPGIGTPRLAVRPRGAAARRGCGARAGDGRLRA